ncbi:hypothetical protein K439DRAFT_274986 [Ramaria rubella]|nr:hypothetical protein K439DRAFT_274986 [Ramaria rubella]
MSTSRSRSNDNLQAGAQPPRQQPSLLSTDDSVSLMQWRGHPYSSFIPSTSPQERFPAFPSPLNTYALPPLPGHSPRLHSYPSEERHFPFPHELPPIASGSRHSLPVNHRRSQVSHHSPGSSQSSPDSSDMRPYQICRENSVESSTNSRRLDAASSGSEASYASASRSDHQFHFTDVDKLDLGGTASVSTLRPSFTREDSHGVLPGDPSFARASSSAHYIDNLYHGGEVTVRREPRFGHDRRSPTARDVNVIEPSKAGRLPNRDYYPLPHHQSQFDALSVNDASFLQERERLGLNTLDCEPGQPPLHSMPIIIECAILGSPHQKLTLSELRITLKRRFRHYEQEEAKGVKSWEDTIDGP